MIDRDVLPITFPAPERLLSPPIIAMEGVAAGYEPGRPVLRDLSLRIDNDDRIALLGSNGNGKSTLSKILAERLSPMGGQITRASKLKIGYFAQHQLDELHLNESAYDHVRALMPKASEAQVRARAGAIGFSADKADTPVSSLSGGEKARLLLGLATFDHPHLIILDEPTNHLDIDSRAALVDAINDYPGAVILVSHDRYLLEACVDRLWLVENGSVAAFDGDLEQYRRMVLRGDRAAPATARPRGNRNSQRSKPGAPPPTDAQSLRPCVTKSPRRKKPSPGTRLRSNGWKPRSPAGCSRRTRRKPQVSPRRAQMLPLRWRVPKRNGWKRAPPSRRSRRDFRCLRGAVSPRAFAVFAAAVQPRVRSRSIGRP